MLFKRLQLWVDKAGTERTKKIEYDWVIDNQRIELKKQSLYFYNRADEHEQRWFLIKQHFRVNKFQQLNIYFINSLNHTEVCMISWSI